jgi:hypothetical protein
MRGMLRVWCRRRFCEDRRQRLSWLREEGSSFSAWWRTLAAERRKQLTTEKGESILKVCLRAHRATCRRAVVAREAAVACQFEQLSVCVWQVCWGLPDCWLAD